MPAASVLDLGRVAWQRGGGRHQGHAALRGEFARRNFVAKQTHHRRRRTDEDQTGSETGFGKLGTLGQKSIARMNRIAARSERHLHDLIDLRDRRVQAYIPHRPDASARP